MNANPKHWRIYYSGTDEELRVQGSYSYSDRIRYYWADKHVWEALDGLGASLKCQSGLRLLDIAKLSWGLEVFGDIAELRPTL